MINTRRNTNTNYIISLAKLSIYYSTVDKTRVQVINIKKLTKLDNACCIFALFLSTSYWKMPYWCKSTSTVFCQCSVLYFSFLWCTFFHWL